MKNLFLQLVLICIKSVLLNGINFENAEKNAITVHGHNSAENTVQNSYVRQDETGDASSYEGADGTQNELPMAESTNLSPLYRRSESKVNYESEKNYIDATNSVTKRDKKSLKKFLDKKVKSSNEADDEYPEAIDDDERAINEALEREYVKQMNENAKGLEEDDDDDKDDEPNNEDEESDQNTNDDDSKEDINLGANLSDENSVSCGEKHGSWSSKRGKENVNWLLLQPSNDSLTVVRHKSLVRSKDWDKNRKKKGVRHELDDEKHKFKDLTDMNTMKKKLSEDDMYKRIMLNLDNDSEKEKEMKKWEKYKSNNGGGGTKRKKQKKAKYKYLNEEDLSHGGSRGLTNVGDGIYGRDFAKAKLKPPVSADYLDLRQGKENRDNVNHSVRRKHKKPLRKFKDNFQDIINNKISKCKDGPSDDSKKQNSEWEVENKDNDSTANKKKTMSKHGKMKHFLGNKSKFHSDNIAQNKVQERNSPIQVYRVDVENRKIIPVSDRDLSNQQCRETQSFAGNSDYLDMPYNISIEFLKDPAAKDMRKRSLKYFTEEYSPLVSNIYENSKQIDNLRNERIFRNDPPAYDKNSVLRKEIVSDVYNAIKAKNPELFGEERVRDPAYFDTEQIRNPELFNTEHVNINNFLKNHNDLENVYNSVDKMKSEDAYNRRSNENNLYPQVDTHEMGMNVNGENNFLHHQFTDSNNEEREIDVKRNANNNKLLSDLSKLIQKKAVKNSTSTTKAYTTERQDTERTSTPSTEATTCIEFFNKYTNNNNIGDANGDKESTDIDWATIPSVCMTSKAGGGDKSRKSKTTQPAKHVTTITAKITGGRQSKATTITSSATFDHGKYPDLLSGRLADRFLEEVSKKINRSRKISRELGFCSEKFKPDPMRRCIETGPEELLPLSSLKGVMYTLKQNKADGSSLCNAVPSELNSFLNYIISNSKQEAKQCLAVKKESNFMFGKGDTNKDDTSLENQNDFNLIPEKQLNLQKSKLNKKIEKSGDYDEEDKENVDDVLTQKVLGNKSNKVKSASSSKDESEFIDDILKDESNRRPRGDFGKSKSMYRARNSKYDYNINPNSVNYGNRDLERFYYGNADTNSETKPGYTTFRDKESDSYDNNYNADSNNDRNIHSDNNNNNGSNTLKNLFSNSIFNTISNKIFKDKPANKEEEEESQFLKAKRQRMSDSTKIKMHNLLYEDGVPEDDDEYYEDDDMRVKKDTESSDAYDEDEDYDYNGYENPPFSDEKRIADSSDLEDAFVVRTPVEDYNSYYK